LGQARGAQALGRAYQLGFDELPGPRRGRRLGSTTKAQADASKVQLRRHRSAVPRRVPAASTHSTPPSAWLGITIASSYRAPFIWMQSLQ
ncbi:hypothetical protein, partial [Mycobacterium simiae]|uniref:hypothetical protein n=1 Tax=Mycobacterium simiae TaxID=1784 RepID=UPI001CB6E723